MSALIWAAAVLMVLILAVVGFVLYQLGTLDGGWAARAKLRWSNWRHRSLRG